MTTDKLKTTTIVMESSVEEWTAEYNRVALIVGCELLPAVQRLADVWASIDLDQIERDARIVVSRERLVIVTVALCVLLVMAAR